MNKFLIIFRIVLGKIFPAKTVSSVLGIGYLPGWQNYWAPFFILFIVDIVLIFIYGKQYLLYGMPDSGIIVASIFIKITVVMLLMQLVGIFIFHAQNPSANSGEHIVIQLSSGQVMTVAFSMPAIMSVYHTVSKLYGGICKQILQCPPWFNDFMHFFFFLMIPYIFFNAVEAVKPWPISTMQLRYNNAISITLEGIFHTLYTMILLYLTAFIFCDLTMHSAIAINKSIMQHTQESSTVLGDYLHNIVKKIKH